jgi:hypothetical protein
MQDMIREQRLDFTCSTYEPSKNNIGALLLAPRLAGKA